MFTTQNSMETSLRWMRRMVVVILIFSNFATVMLADAAPARQDTQPPSTIQAGTVSWWRHGSMTEGRISALLQNGNFGFAITGLNATAVSLASRETGANPSQLMITTR